MLWDKRRRDRKAVEMLEVSCVISNKEFKSYAKDISEKGICMRAPEDLKKGDKLNLHIRLFPNLPAVKDIQGNVVWKADNGTVGLKFKRVTAEQLELVQGFVNN